MFMELGSGNWIRFLVCCILHLNFDNCFFFWKNAIQPLKKDDVQKWLSFLKNMADEKVNSSGWRSHWDLTRRQFPTKTRKAFRHNLFSQLVVTQNIRLSLERLVPYRRDSSRYHPFSQIVKSIENETVFRQQMKHCDIDKSKKLNLGKVISVFDNV